MSQFDHFQHESFQASSAFLYEGDVAIADDFLDGQRRHEAAWPSIDQVGPGVVEITVSLLVFELAFLVSALDGVDCEVGEC